MASDDARDEVAAGLLARHLRELIAALDRRVPQIEREGEIRIAREAAELKDLAVARLAELSQKR
jgi:hypothetical protein